MTSTTTDQRQPLGGFEGGLVPRVVRRYRKHAGRTLTVSTTVGEPAWGRVEGRAIRARLALGSWMVLLAGDVAAGRPVAAEVVLEDLVDARVRVARLGTAVNAIARRENRGIDVEDRELLKVLDSLGARAVQATAALSAAREVFAGWRTAPGKPGPGAAGAGVAGRRSKDQTGRARRIRAAMTPGERDLLAGAAAREGLSVGAWLAQLLEDPGAVRPLHGEVLGAVVALRQAGRRVATTLAQIQDARTDRGTGTPPAVGAARAQVDALIRACLGAESALSGQATAGVTR